MNVIEWVKHHKLSAFFLLVLLYILLKITFPYGFPINTYEGGGTYGLMANTRSISLPRTGGGDMAEYGYAPTASPSAESVDVTPQDRKVVEETNLSLLVKDVSQTVQDIKSTTTTMGGFMVNANVTHPEEASSGNITIRVPSAKSDEMLMYLRGLAVKVVSENLRGYDVTDKYTDITTRIETLKSTKARLAEIMELSQSPVDILSVQTQIFRVQDQIDALIGQQKYIENTSSSVKISVYLSTDEYSLPYAPQTNWRPDVVFKMAVRSLVQTARGLVNRLIWIAVFSILWIPALFLIFIARAWWKKRKGSQKSIFA